MDIFSVLIETFIITVFVDFWNSQFLSENRLFARRQEKALFCFLMALCAAGVLLALLRWSAADVRSESGEVIFYFVFSLAGIVAVHYVFAFFGISLRDDAIERRNRAALCAVSGLTTGASCCIAGANAGNGPGGEVVFFCATLSIGTLFVFWVLLATIADMAEAITVERDLGAGVRAGAFLASCGAIFAAVVAGDWISLSSTLRDFIHFTWPVFAGSVTVIAFERTNNRRSLGKRLSTLASCVLSAALMIAAVTYAIWAAKQ
jgi:hypothetical protein